MIKRDFFSYYLLICVIALSGINGCRNNEGLTERIDIENYTINHQQKIGARLEQEVLAASDLYPILNPSDDRALLFLKDTVFSSIILTVDVAHRTDYDWDIYIIDNDQLEKAFALPGGKIFVYSGLLKFINSLHELVQLLAHEVANIDKGYAIQNLDREFGGIVMGDFYLDNEEIEDLETVISYFENIKYPDQEVLKADEYAVSLLCNNFTYNGLGIYSLINRMDSLSNPIDWIMDGPSDLNNRMSKLAQLVDEKDCDYDFRGESIYARFKNVYLP